MSEHRTGFLLRLSNEYPLPGQQFRMSYIFIVCINHEAWPPGGLVADVAQSYFRFGFQQPDSGSGFVRQTQAYIAAFSGRLVHDRFKSQTSLTKLDSFIVVPDKDYGAPNRVKHWELIKQESERTAHPTVL
jgi:hypothetical protein